MVLQAKQLHWSKVQILHICNVQIMRYIGTNPDIHKWNSYEEMRYWRMSSFF